MKTILMVLVFWAGINDAVMMAALSVVGSNEAAAIKGAAFIPPLWAVILVAFVAFAKSLEKSIAGWIERLRGEAGSREQGGASARPPGVLGVAAMAAVLMMMTAGCHSPVPGNSIKGFIGGMPFSISNPKNTTMSGVLLSNTQGTNTFSLSISNLSSTNDPQVIDKAYAGQAFLMKTTLEGVKDIAGEVVKKLAEGAKTVQVNGPPGQVTGGMLPQPVYYRKLSLAPGNVTWMPRDGNDPGQAPSPFSE